MLFVQLPNPSSNTLSFRPCSLLNLAALAGYIDSIGRWFIRLAFHLPYKGKMCPVPGAMRGNRQIFFWCYKDTRLIKFAPALNLTWRWSALTFKSLFHNSQNNWWLSFIFKFSMQINLFFFFHSRSKIFTFYTHTPCYRKLTKIFLPAESVSPSKMYSSIHMQWDRKILPFKPKSPAFAFTTREWNDL